jgi:hypothetical protein
MLADIGLQSETTELIRAVLARIINWTGIAASPKQWL